MCKPLLGKGCLHKFASVMLTSEKKCLHTCLFLNPLPAKFLKFSSC